MSLRSLLMMLFLLVVPTSEPRSVRHVETLPYPIFALQARIEGEVRLRVTVGLDGRVAMALVIASDHPFLLHAAEENIQKWKFSPGGEESIDIVYKFVLRDPPVETRADTQCLFDLPNEVTVVSQKLKPIIDATPMGRREQQ